jgi:hypothetical protein
MGKFSAFAVLLVIAISIYFLNPNTQVPVSTSQPENIETIPTTKNAEIAENQAKAPVQILKPTNTDSHKDHAGHDDDNIEIPQFIKDSLEAKRIPASELVTTQHAGDSTSIDLKGQFQHVPVAVIGKDGKVKIIETQIQPITE